MMVPALTWDPWCTSAHAPEDLEDERAKVSNFHSELTQLYLTVNLHIIPQSPTDDQVFTSFIRSYVWQKIDNFSLPMILVPKLVKNL
jgi:hypothetical protein